MKLLTHNFLACNIKGVTRNYPFKIDPQTVEETEADFDPDFLRHMYPKLDWAALKGAAETLGVSGLPDSVTEDMLANDNEFLQLFHHSLLEVTLEEGALICPESGRRFPVKKGIPNMLLREDEC